MLHYVCNGSLLQLFPLLVNYTDDNGAVHQKGFQIDLLNRVAEMANFDYELRFGPDNTYGVQLNETTWTGIIGDIMSKVIINDEVYMYRKLLKKLRHIGTYLSVPPKYITQRHWLFVPRRYNIIMYCTL